MALNIIIVSKCAVCVQFARSLQVKKNRHRLTCRDAICPKLRANCANCKQTAPTTSHLGKWKATQFCRWNNKSWFFNRALVALPLILLTILDLKMQTLLNLIGLYFLNLKTLLIIRPLISYLSNTWKGAPRVII